MIIVNPYTGVCDKGGLTIEVMTQLAAHRRRPIWTLRTRRPCGEPLRALDTAHSGFIGTVAHLNSLRS